MTDGSVGFWGHLRQRIIVISTMERDVRATFIIGLTIVTLAIGLNIFPERLGPPVSIPVGSIPLGVIVVLALGEFAVFFFISLAVLLLKGRRRYIVHVILLVTFAIFAAMNLFDALSFALLLPMTFLWVFTFLGNWQKWIGREYVLGALATSLAAMLVFLLYVAVGREALIISALGWQGLLAMFGLCMAATDIAEVVVVAVESSTEMVAKVLRPIWAAVLFAVTAIASNLFVTVKGIQFDSSQPVRYSWELGGATGVALWVGLMYWLIVSRRKKFGSVPPHIDYRMLFIIVGFYFWAFQAGILFRFLSNPATYRPREVFTYPEVFEFTTLGWFVIIVLFFVVGRRSKRNFVRLAYAVSVGYFIFQYYVSKGGDIVRIIGAVAMGSLLFLMFAPLSHKLRKNFKSACLILADLNLAFVVYALVVALFLSMGGHSGPFSVGQALIVLAALSWDIVTSGEAITNRHTDTFPRLARVALFMAYALSVALLVMVSTAGHFVSPTSSEVVEAVFNSEVLVGFGLIMFGGPFIFVLAALRFRNLLATADASTTAPELPSKRLPAPILPP